MLREVGPVVNHLLTITMYYYVTFGNTYDYVICIVGMDIAL